MELPGAQARDLGAQEHAEGAVLGAGKTADQHYRRDKD
jgi:hypothetical protein